MDEDKPHNLFDMIEGAIDFYEENKDLVKSIAPDEQTLKIDDKEPLKSAIVQDDSVIITVEVPGGGINQISLNEVEGDVVIGIGEERLRAEVPDDVNTDSAEANLNNGVLEVELPRENGDE